MKTPKVRARSANPLRYKLGFPLVLLCCTFFFLVGFYGSNSLSKEEKHVVIDPVTNEKLVFEHGRTGDSSVTDIPFQVLSWKPRALLYPNFASKEQCEAIIKLARTRLAPSGLALRKGESEATTKEIRTSSGTFLRASEDKTQSLAEVEEKMARATMIPRQNGEVKNTIVTMMFLIQLSMVLNQASGWLPFSFIYQTSKRAEKRCFPSKTFKI
uniref:Prolyl 4-hydroxylase alpha subunit domain-containing protein n=1 Tax=Physcomitrium patens TaxID=3218 RepID=A0A7I4FA62_PHYPA